MKKFCMCVALLTVTVVITASDQKKPKPNPAVERVKKTDRPSNIDRSAGSYLSGGNRSAAPSNKRPRPTQKPPKAQNPNT